MRKGSPKFDGEINDSTRYAIVTCRWNSEFNDEMVEGAKDAFRQKGIKDENVEVFHAPGAFEMPVLALELADTENYDAILCFATVVKGDTFHFELVVNEAARGLMDAALSTGVPIMNGILAVENEEQAEFRASRSKENKGYEVALSAMDIATSVLSVRSH